jgi:A/G-specific adenine glycosylase
MLSAIAMPPAAALLDWYDRHRRTLPWRAAAGETPDPYHVWLSEIMLQQTTVTAVIPYYRRFVSRFPTIEALARADLDDVLLLWSGLGYYARARNLHACAREVVRLGGFPRDLPGLRRLPGIGVYTAAAMRAIAFDQPALPVDGNVERVVARLFAVDQPLPAAKPVLRALAERLANDALARERPSDFAQALFDLGATVCAPTSPSCPSCPWRNDCTGAGNEAASFPRRSPKPARPHRYAAHFWLIDAQERVLLRQRPHHGLMGGLFELPGTTPAENRLSELAAVGHAPQPADWRVVGEVRHGFTHFELTITVFAARVARITAPGPTHNSDGLAEVAMASVMRKCVTAARLGTPPPR